MNCNANESGILRGIKAAEKKRQNKVSECEAISKSFSKQSEKHTETRVAQAWRRRKAKSESEIIIRTQGKSVQSNVIKAESRKVS
jgi:hypothetical protein